MHYEYLIVGAGLFGSVFAREMAERGARCLVIDARNHVGGNIYTEEKMGIHVHKYGAHIFHTSDEEVWAYVRRFADFNHYINAPVAVWKDELYNLPFNMNTFSRMWGIRTPAEAKEIIGRQTEEAIRRILSVRLGKAAAAVTGEEIASFEAANLEEQGLSLAGKDIFEKLVKGYTEKQWGRDCRELPAFILRRLPFRFVYDNNYFNDPYQGIPREGYTALIERMLGGTPEAVGKINVRLSTPYEAFVRLDDDGLPARPFASVSGDTFGRIVFTGRIDAFFRQRLGRLEYRSLRFEEETLCDVDNFQGNAVVNYTEREIPYTRIIEHKHFNFGAGKGTIITREYPAEWKADGTPDGTQGDEPYYPMNDDKNNRLYEVYAARAAKDWPDVVFGGRLGQYKYFNMDQVIRSALDAAEKM